jgi:PAS domain S-box-containing protein
MHRLLRRQLRRHFGDNFDLLTMPKELQGFIDDVDKSYDHFEEEKKFLEHTIDLNFQDLEKANKRIRDQNATLKASLHKTSDENEDMIHVFKQYKEAIDLSLIVSVTDLQGNINYVNDNFVNISGYSREELLRKTHSIVRHPNNPPSLFNDLWKTIRSKKIWQGTLSNRAKDGSTYYVHTTIVPLVNKEGEIVEFMGLRRDVTENIVYQNHLEAQKNRVSQILDNQESIIVLFDEKRGVVQINKKFQEIFGFASLVEFEQQHQCICELFTPKENFLQNGDNGFWAEPILEDPDKTHLAMIKGRIYSVKVASIILENKPIYLATFTDITEIEDARIRSEELVQEKSNFLANMSHEIRTPMNAILGFSELLVKSQLDTKQRHYVDLIRSSSKTLIEIINDILDFSKLESEQTMIEQVKINPFVEFEETFFLLWGKAKEKNITYSVEIDPSLGECIELDSFHIKQILINLIGNAIKFTPQEGIVRIQLEKILSMGHYAIRFSIQDSGIGIASDRLKKIFEPFSQADSSTTRKFGGTGLGLSISSRLVKLMGSELLVESKEGEGSRFYFDIPYEKCELESILKNHLNDFTVYLFGVNETLQIRVATQLQAYRVPFSVLKFYDEKVDLDNAIIIGEEESFLRQFTKAKVLLLSKTHHDLDNQRCHQIENFDEFPSALYNQLARLKVISNEVKIKHDKKIGLKILIAEDYEINRFLMSALLDQFKIHYTFVHNGQEAVDKVQQESFDLILMDINMPVMNGMDATKIIKEELGVSTPIVALTANALEGDREKFLSLGMDDYLSKPIDIKAFETLLERYSHNTVIVDEEPKVTLNIEQSLLNVKEKMKYPEKIIGRLFESYVASLDTLEKNLYEGIAHNDWTKIQINAHNLKSGAAALCFDKVAQMAQAMESAAKNRDEHFEYEATFQELLPYLQICKKHREKFKNFSL